MPRFKEATIENCPAWRRLVYLDEYLSPEVIADCWAAEQRGEDVVVTGGFTAEEIERAKEWAKDIGETVFKDWPRVGEHAPG